MENLETCYSLFAKEKQLWKKSTYNIDNQIGAIQND